MQLMCLVVRLVTLPLPAKVQAFRTAGNALPHSPDSPAINLEASAMTDQGQNPCAFLNRSKSHRDE